MRRYTESGVVKFQSTPPRREMTPADAETQHAHEISIHTSPKGDDCVVLAGSCVRANFNPHLPEGR